MNNTQNPSFIISQFIFLPLFLFQRIFFYNYSRKKSELYIIELFVICFVYLFFYWTYCLIRLGALRLEIAK